MSGQNTPSARPKPVSPRTRRAPEHGQTASGTKRTTTTGRTAKVSKPPAEAVVVQLPRRRAAATKSRATKPRGGPKRKGAAGKSISEASRPRPVESITPLELRRPHAPTAKRTPRKRSRPDVSRASAPPQSAPLKRTRRPESSPSEIGGPTSAAGGPVSRSMDAVAAWLKTQIGRLLDGMRNGEELLTKKIREWMDTLVDAVADGGPGMNAGL